MDHKMHMHQCSLHWQPCQQMWIARRRAKHINFSNNSKNLLVVSLKMSMNLCLLATGRSVDDHICDTAFFERLGRVKALCCNDPQRKGVLDLALPGNILLNPLQIVFDFHQLPRESLPQLRDTLLSLLANYSKGPKPIRTQLCVCLANLAIQMLEWKDVLQMVVTTLGNDSSSIACVLEFLHVLPEEVTEGRKINLTVCSTAISAGLQVTLVRTTIRV